MTQLNTKSNFESRLLCPNESSKNLPRASIILPKKASEKLTRRGRVSVDGCINGQVFRALLEPDGNKSHWLRISHELFSAAGAAIGEIAKFEIEQVAEEPTPELPSDFHKALLTSAKAQLTWSNTTNIAQVDWIHWITSAKQNKTRVKRIADACDMLASGKKRVCCFDPSGFYSKAFGSPKIAE